MEVAMISRPVGSITATPSVPQSVAKHTEDVAHDVKTNILLPQMEH